MADGWTVTRTHQRTDGILHTKRGEKEKSRNEGKNKIIFFYSHTRSSSYQTPFSSFSLYLFPFFTLFYLSFAEWVSEVTSWVRERETDWHLHRDGRPDRIVSVFLLEFYCFFPLPFFAMVRLKVNYWDCSFLFLTRIVSRQLLKVNLWPFGKKLCVCCYLSFNFK